MLPILYKYTSTMKVQQWQVVIEGDGFYTIEGLKDGKLTTSLPTKVTQKNIGKKNETSLIQQAIIEGNAKHKKKLDEGYNEILSEEKKFFEPMLAKDFDKYADKIDFKSYNVFIQPKLDGLRCISQNNTLMSRNGIEYVSCPHLHQNDTILDGELYFHDKDADNFNQIVSICKKKKPTPEDLSISREFVKMYCYDFPSYKGTFTERFEALASYILSHHAKSDKVSSLVLVPTYQVRSIKEIEQFHKKFLEQGYEGSIIRLDIQEYENKRSKQLLKKKDFIDAEFEIIGYEEGKGGRINTLGKFLLKMPDGSTGESDVNGGHDLLRDIWKNKDAYIGKLATVEYFGLTPKGKFRFPRITKLDRQSYE